VLKIIFGSDCKVKDKDFALVAHEKLNITMSTGFYFEKGDKDQFIRISDTSYTYSYPEGSFIKELGLSLFGSDGKTIADNFVKNFNRENRNMNFLE